ncbi:hypothetical protein GQ55_6G048500 [Panicum hallii var. hallii]|uniref:Uncharacterized protein n=1 Tax=Panicum hallii var. hallii TaxID=1504633 RepID=A0A2T7D3Z3_9POAL|nr:hypothetical protein GQ55_6G048500 [Panicum hallii var. hallii]
MASASTSPSLSLSGQLLLQVSSPRVGRLGVTRQRSSSLSMAVGGPASPVQPPAQGNGGGGGQVHVATPRAAALMAVRGPTLLGHLPAEGTGGGGGKVHAAPTWALRSVGGPTTPPARPPAEGGGGKIHAVLPAAAPAAKSYWS